jgi:predicted ATPase/class 3 adenylate cyclase
MDLALICPECQTSNREGANFCRRCGRLLVDHCPRCRIELLPDSDFCDHCALPLTPVAALGWAAGGDHSHTGGEEHADLTKFGAHAAVKEPLVVEINSLASAEQQMPSSEAPPLDRYIPAELREKLDSARSTGEMVGERRIVTMLFCDVKGSTAAAEGLDPEEWTEIINGAFEHMIKSVYKYEGTVARLMGDGILAFFGAPITHEDDPQRAVLAGLDIVNRISTYRERINQTWGIDINVRVGINTGLVVVGTVGSDLRMEYSAMGDAINLAARMEQTAEPGTVQLAYDTYKIVNPIFEIEELGGMTIKGKSDPVLTYRVLGPKIEAGRQRGIEGLHAPLVGRDSELATLQNIFSNVQQGVGHIVSVIGDAGLGKSRLIHEAKRSLESGQSLDWIETASLSYETNQPYAPFQRLIRHLNNMNPGDSIEQVREKLAKLRQQFDESSAQRVQHLFEALFDLESDKGARLEGEAFKRELYAMMPVLWRQRFSQQPSVLVFEDIHWSDPASIELLLHLFHLTSKIPLVLLCAFRPERGDPVWRIKTTADEEFHHLYTEIIVRPLSDKQVNEMIDGLLIHTDLPQSLRARILESAAGNPFFVEEVVRSLIDNQALVAEQIEQDGQKMLYWRAKDDGQQIDLPDNLQSLLASRIDRLEEETRQLLQTAAVIGRSFYRRVLQAIEAQSQEATQDIDRQLTLLLRLEMIREATRLPELEYKFSNPLTQEVAYQTILLKRRRELHRRVGLTLEQLFPDQLGELAPLLAYHFAEGELHDKAFEYYMMAGDSAARLFANIEAVDLYTQALDFIESVDTGYEKLEALYLRRGRALELLSRYEDSLENYEAMLKLAQDRNDKRLELAAKMAQATIHSIPSKVFDGELSLQLSEEARSLAHELGESSAEAKINWNLMLQYLWVSFQFEQAVKHGEAAAKVARDSNLTVELGPVLNDLALAYFGVGRLDESLQTYEESRTLLRDGNNLPLLALNLTNSATIQFLIGNNELAQALMDEAESTNHSIENHWGLAGSLYYRGLIHLIHGSWGVALTTMNGSIEFCELAQAEMLLAVSLLAKANYCIFVGATETGLSLCRKTMKSFEEHLPHFQGYPWGLMSQLYLIAGDHTSAREALHTSLANLDLDLPPTPTFSSIEVRIAEIKFRLADGHPELATERVGDLLDYLEQFHVRQFRSDALLLKAKALLALDQPKEASEILSEACRQAEALSTQPILWQILDTQADVLERLDDPDQAKSKRDQARVILTTLADSIVEGSDRITFLNLPDVRRLLEYQVRRSA